MSRDGLRGRLHSHLTNHYLQLHTTLVSVSLAAAGFAAASLATATDGQPDSGWLLWLMWGGGLLAVAVVYAGTLVGGFALPPRIPAVWDLVIPMAIGLSQFLLFGVLTRSIAPFGDTQTVLRAWLLAMAALGVFSVVGILRARQLVREQDYEAELGNFVHYYRRRLRSDALGACILALVSVAGAVYLSINTNAAPLWFYTAVGGVLLILVFGLLQHQATGRRLRRKMD